MPELKSQTGGGLNPEVAAELTEHQVEIQHLKTKMVALRQKLEVSPSKLKPIESKSSSEGV